jgi:signal transduction histidine kinase
MMWFMRRLIPGTIAGQITGLVIIAVLLGVGLASAVLLYLIDQGQTGPNREILATVRAAHIAAIAKEAEAANSKEQLSLALKRSHSNSIEATLVPAAGLAVPGEPAPASPFIAAVEASLRDNWGLESLRRASQPGDEDSIFLKLGDDNALRFEISPHSGLHNLLFVQTICALAIITSSIVFLSIYAVRWIISPLSSIASAARSFGRTGGDETELSVDGPREIEQAAQALNDMRKRVRTLVNERTQMLVAISHDLRTPLTRLRLRVERLKDEPPRAAMLQDIVTINEMLGETLAYVRQGAQREEASLIDLPSLLETIAAQFADIGHEVSYSGPDRLAFAGRAQAIGRAVANVVENATKFGSRAVIILRALDDGAVETEIFDDGPGIAPGLLDRVFEPFFKGDSARSIEGRTGFGLGLSIARDIADRHGGDIALVNREPHGLSVRMTFKPLQLTQLWGVTSAA